ncbi:MAG: P-loop NTPase fold protein [Parcubacteria group bacterium]
MNKHIKEYLDYYCSVENHTPFAVLLKGKWGCGKTYFIRNYIENNKNKKFLHISLYGLDNLDMIKEKIIVELIPFIPKKYNKFVSTILRNAKKIQKIKDWIPSDTNELLVDIFLKKNNESVFIFDDLERCNIEIGKLLGYINNFIEFQNQKVILIANEDEIIKSKEFDKYGKYKEKLIGKEFVVNTDKEGAIERLVKDIQNNELQEKSECMKKNLLEIFAQSKYNNLRLMQQALSHFEYFYKTFSSKATENEELFERMFYEFIVIFIEYKNGVIKSDDFFKKYPQFFKEFGTNDESHHFLNKYRSVISHALTCFDVVVLGKILQGINLDEEEKKEFINNIEKIADIDKESWQKLWYCYEQSDGDFFDNLEDVQNKWKKKEYLDLHIVLHIFGMFIDFSENGMLDKSKKDILNESKDYIEFLISEKTFPLNLHERNTGFSWKESAFGFGYYGLKSIEWNELMKFVDEKIDDLREEYIKQKIAKELMPILKGETSAVQGLYLLMNHNFLQTNGNSESYFQFFDVREIGAILVKSDRMFLSALQKTFKERYGKMKIKIKDINKELPFLEKLKHLLEREIGKIEKKFGNKRTPRSSMLQSFIKESIQPFIEK